MRKTVVRVLRDLDAVSVENPVGAGTPDVNFIGGWMELKSMDHWPRGTGAGEPALIIEHYTQTQRVWSIKRWRKGGLVLLLLKVGRDWLLFEAPIAAEFVGRVNRERLFEVALESWKGGLKEEEFLGCLRKLSRRERGSF